MTIPERPNPEPAIALLRSNAVDFLNSGLETLFDRGAGERQGKLAVIAIQTAVELFAKQRLVVDYGLESILRGRRPRGDLLKAARTGSLRTIGFAEALKVIHGDEAFTASDREIVGNAQELRNALVHFAAELQIEDIRQEMAWLLVRVLAMFAAGQERDQGEMQNHKRFLDPGNFETLISYPPYRDEAVDCALDSADTADVLRCWECEQDTLSARLSGSYFCYCCGFTVDGGAVAHADCVVCDQHKGVFYDPLNSTRGVHAARCLHCDTPMGVSVCVVCSQPRAHLSTDPAPPCGFCEDGPEA